MSLHRHPFYPYTGSHLNIGLEKGKGYSVNIPWPGPGYSDSDYALAFLNVILPILTQYDPQLILVSCGFDSAVGDWLGDGGVTPNGFQWMTSSLISFEKPNENGSHVPIVLALEGGYSLDSLKLSSEAVVRGLLGEQVVVSSKSAKEDTQSILESVRTVLGEYWNFEEWVNYDEKRRVIEN
jgi:histone deacetylase 6